MIQQTVGCRVVWLVACLMAPGIEQDHLVTIADRGGAKLPNLLLDHGHLNPTCGDIGTFGQTPGEMMRGERTTISLSTPVTPGIPPTTSPTTCRSSSRSTLPLIES